MTRLARVATYVCWILATATAQQPRDIQPGTFGGVDGLGRVLPTHEQCGPPRRDRFVMLFYFLWLGAHGYDEHRQPPPDGGVWPKEDRAYASPFDLTKILAAAKDGAAPAFGPVHAFHHWGEPHLGYYLSDDEAVLRRHAYWFADAGIDAIALDVTNALTYTANYQRLLAVYADLRAQGVPVPQVTFLANAGARAVTDALWRDLYGPRRHEDLWFRWRGKPLLLAPPEEVDPAHRDFFTLRRSWAWSAGAWFGDGKDAWPWLDHHPQQWGWHDSPAHREALAVAVAQHPTTNIGRSFHDGKQPPPGEQEPARGLCFQEQWERAFAVDPELVFVTGWNEWTAMRFLSDGLSPMCGRTLPAGDSFFVDLWSQEYSRDLEPMRGGHEDAYYWQLVANVRRFKGVPAPGAAEFLDHRGDDFGRDHPGYGSAGPYRQAAAANDLLAATVAHDAASVTFLVRAARPIAIDPAARDAMLLCIDSDCDPGTGFCGFDLLVGGQGHRDGETSIERFGNGWHERTQIGTAATHRSGTEFTVQLPRALLAQADRPLAFDFQWVDGVGDRGRRVDWLDRGDCAPDGRFTYRYRSP